MTEKKSAPRGVSWEAEEYVQVSKNGGWYAGLIGVTVLLGVGSVILKWWSFLVLIILSAVALILYSVRPPRKLHYSLSSKGLMEGEKLYPLDEFRSFGVMQEGEHYAIVLTPRKQLASRLTVYFPKESGEAIVDFFGARMPMEEVRYDFIDKIVKFLRF